MCLIDLSHPIVPFADNPYAQFPVGPKNMMGVTNVFDDVGWLSRAWYRGQHCGTHVDAPIHFNPTGTAVDRLPLDWLFGEAVVLNFASKKAGRGRDGARDRRGRRRARWWRARRRAHRAGALRAKPGLWGTPEYHRDMINMSPEATEWLLRRRVRVVGCDACVWEVDRGSRPEASGRRRTLSRAISQSRADAGARLRDHREPGQPGPVVAIARHVSWGAPKPWSAEAGRRSALLPSCPSEGLDRQGE